MKRIICAPTSDANKSLGRIDQPTKRARTIDPDPVSGCSISRCKNMQVSFEKEIRPTTEWRTILYNRQRKKEAS